MTKDEHIALLSKMVRKAVEARTESRKQIVSVMCFAPEEERVKLKKALATIETSLQHTASHYAARRNDLIRGVS